MKHITAILLAACLTACLHPTPGPDPLVPPPVVHIEPSESGSYIIIEFDSEGTPLQTWEVSDFTETDFPRTVTFTGHACKIVTLRGSYEIRERMNSK